MMGEPRKVALVRADGRYYAGLYVEVGKSAADDGQNPRNMREVEIPGDWPDRWQRFDEGSATWIDHAADRAAAVDDAYLANNGPLAIRMAHVQKAIEAQHIVAGRDMPDGLVAAEAAATGVERQELAAAIVAKAKIDYVPEVERRAAKLCPPTSDDDTAPAQ
uniref:hypothetical protein n=1 Tax=uncultured Sphingomonas sp. TaxID=158754 RepID=UPI0035CB715A